MIPDELKPLHVALRCVRDAFDAYADDIASLRDSAARVVGATAKAGDEVKKLDGLPGAHDAHDLANRLEAMAAVVKANCDNLTGIHNDARARAEHAARIFRDFELAVRKVK